MKDSNVSYSYCFCVLNVSYLYVTTCLFFEEMKDSYVSYLYFIHVLNVSYLRLHAIPPVRCNRSYFLISTFTLSAVFNKATSISRTDY